MAVGCQDSAQEQTEILVSIKSASALTSLSLRARGIDDSPGASDTITEDVTGRDLALDPFKLLLRPSPLLGERFLLYVKGVDGVTLRASGSTLLSFTKGKRSEAELSLREDFIDADDDGFAACLNEGCDCNDANARINPFTLELCNDLIDNNCSGLPINEGCPCNANDPPVACTKLPENLRHLAGVGACFLGYLQCVDGALETNCVSGEPSAEEPGNFIDDDCDGSVDEDTTCTAAATRPCHRGFVDDTNHPITAERTAASDRALGKCHNTATNAPFGVQTCSNAGRWGLCLGDVLPQRDPVAGFGFIELPPFGSEPGQCDGEDNDCDGMYDEETFFDADQDGYTLCGSTFTPQSGNPSLNAHTAPGRDAVFVDCDDDEAQVNPSATEVCGNTVDEDCRCDHDPASLPVGQNGSVIGLPTKRLDDSLNCSAPFDALNCGLNPRSDSNAVGLCSDEPNAYYRGAFTSSTTGDKACFYCGASFGNNCGQTQACTTKEDDCNPCSDSGTPDEADIAQARPMCRDLAPATCAGLTPPTWDEVGVADPFDDCGLVACTGFYAGITNGRCFERADQTADEVLCKAGGVCQTAQDLCALETMAKSTHVPQGLCSIASSGCTGATAAVYSAQANGQDAFDECNSAFDCAAGSAFYFDLVDDTPSDGNNALTCKLRADVSNSACGGAPLSNGASSCQTRAQACIASGQGGTAPGRPSCQEPTGGCTGTTPPVYSNVQNGQDPYNDCPGAFTCNGQGSCRKADGDVCTQGNQCESTNCVDGVCCGASSCGTCQACQAGTGTCAAITAANDPGTCDGACSYCDNGTCTNRTAGATDECDTCQQCNAPGGSCVAFSGAEGKSCIGTDSFCCAGTCVDPAGTPSEYGGSCGTLDECAGTWGCSGNAARCSTQGSVCASCNGDERRTGTCDASGTCSGTTNNCSACSTCVDNGSTTSCVDVGQYSDDNTTPGTCNGNNTCDGLGSCKIENGQTCSNDGQCASNQCECADAGCLTKVCSATDCNCAYNSDGLGPCDEALNNGVDDADNTCGGNTCTSQVGVCN